MGSREIMGEETERIRRLRNFLAMNLQKMELELKCHSCLSLMNQPIWLPCNHLFCSQCITTLSTKRSSCPVCAFDFASQDMRLANHMEAIINIYRSMKSVIGASLLQDVSRFDILETPSSECPVSGHTDGEEKPQEPIPDAPRGKSTSFSGDVKIDRPIALSSVECLGKSQDDIVIRKGKLCGYSSVGEGHDSSDRRCKYRKRGRPAKNVSKNVSKEESIKNIESDSHESKRQKVIGYGRNASPHPIVKNMAECAFCHSARITENTGPMLHFAGGKPLDDTYASHPKVMHAHQNCIEWAPKAYFEGEVAMNLAAEVSRAGKLRCSYCGLKGAALGCFAKKCRKCFHMPCAMEIPECRWDFDNYHFLCPVHTSNELPCDVSPTSEKSKFNSSLSAERDTSYTSRQHSPTLKVEADESSAASPSVAKGWVLSESFLSSEDKDLFHKFATLIGANVAKAWNENITHIVASTDERGACTRTLKVLMGILTGRWILKIDWIKACLEAGHPVPEDPYEITHDVHGCYNGPKNGRMRAINKAPKLLTGLSFHLMGYFMPYYKSYLEDLVATGGGVILNNTDLSNLQKSTSPSLHNIFVVYSSEPPQGSNPEDLGVVIKKRASEAEALASKIGGRAVDHTWLLDSIAASSLRM